MALPPDEAARRLPYAIARANKKCERSPPVSAYQGGWRRNATATETSEMKNRYVQYSRTCFRILLSLCLCGALSFVLFALQTACSSSGQQQPKSAAAVPVTVTKAIVKEMPVEITAIGNVQPVVGVAIRSQVTGRMLRVNFKEGDYVRKGELLFSLDSRPFDEALKGAQANLQHDISAIAQAQAVLEKDAAQAKYAAVEATRYNILMNEGVVSQEDGEQFKANADAFGATLKADGSNIDTARAQMRQSQAAVDNARVQLSYTQLRSPMDGRTSSSIVTEGNLVSANDPTPLVTINQVSPINVAFTVPEKYLSDVQKYASSGKLKVVAQLDANNSRVGSLSAFDNQVSTTTGTLQLKASFRNDDNLLWPGRFVNIVLTLTNEPNAIVVPTQAVQTSQQGQFIYVIKADQTVEMRKIALDRTIGDEAVIASGLGAGETVITDGQLRVTPGAKVQIATTSSGNSNGAGL
jgi:multidrug efflux system membrane fusion protein